MRNTLVLPYTAIEFSTCWISTYRFSTSWFSTRLIARHDNKKIHDEVR